MKNYIILAILGIVLLFIVFSNRSTYTATTAAADVYVTFFAIGSDINPAVTATVASSDNGLTIDQINRKLWQDAGFTSYWGIRKQLTLGGSSGSSGGGGAVSYLTFANDAAATAALTQQADVLTTYSFQGTTYTIPTYIFVKKSISSPIIECSNGTAAPSGTSCICPAGRYLSDQYTCSLCPVGSYCLGGTSSYTGCTSGQTSIAGSINSAACYSPCSGNATASAATTSSGATCVCRAGYAGNGITCNSCAAGSYSPAGAASCTQCAAGTYAVGAASANCTPCAAGTTVPGAVSSNACYTVGACSPNASSTSATTSAGPICTCLVGYAGNGTTCNACGNGNYSVTTGASACSQCPAGTASNATVQSTSCPTCAAGQYSVAGASVCSNCPTSSSNSVAGSVAASACWTPCSINATSTTATTTSGATCTCKAGYLGSGITCNPNWATPAVLQASGVGG